MTLTDAIKILRKYVNLNSLDENVKDAIKTIICLCPEQPMNTETAPKRLSYIRSRLIEMKKGFDPFCKRTREEPEVIWRHAVFYKLKMEGFSYHEIADACGYDHTTILWGVKSIKDGLSIGYPRILNIWLELNNLLKEREDGK